MSPWDLQNLLWEVLWDLQDVHTSWTAASPCRHRTFRYLLHLHGTFRTPMSPWDIQVPPSPPCPHGTFYTSTSL